MAKKALQPATLAVVQAIAAHVHAPMLVAVSGGADSLALAAGAAIAGRRGSLLVRAVVVDHQLQPDSAAVAAATVAKLAELGVPAEVVAVDVVESGDGLEAAARQARYDALAACAQPGEVVLLGHTLDDQAETVLLGLARGSGTRSLAGMPAVRGGFVRPLLGIRRATTRQCCLEMGITWWDDPLNADERFARVRVRQTVLPMLEAQLGPGIAEALARTAQLATQDADYLDELAAQAAVSPNPDPANPSAAQAHDSHSPAPDQVGISTSRLPVDVLAPLPTPIRLRVLRDWLRAQGATDLSYTHLQAVDTLITDWHGQKGITIPGLTIHRHHNLLHP
ncbi:MAG: tRNA lysidine(34) synthetase TilS [Propionibacteriaceae bacterium]|jgi:tRNA(Ile)-lysidine synthase|nr:tRNA lysidine(34) synthetase TilS [Propionibacteriaceae bacterium]